jgi:hypothetical protein
MREVQGSNLEGVSSRCRQTNVKLSLLFITEHHAIKAYWGSGGIFQCMLDIGTRRNGQLHISAANPRERAPGIHCIGGWVGPRAGLDAVVRRKISSPYRNSNPPIMQPVAQRYTTKLSRLPSNESREHTIK